MGMETSIELEFIECYRLFKLRNLVCNIAALSPGDFPDCVLGYAHFEFDALAVVHGDFNAELLHKGKNLRNRNRVLRLIE